MNKEESTKDTQSTKVLLIDLENCPKQILQLQEDLEQYSQVVIFYTKTGVKIPLDWLMPLSDAITQNKLKIYKMTHIGKNSADVGICFFAGALMQQFQKKVNFSIISNDLDLDHVISLLVDQGCIAERIGLTKENLLIKTEYDLEISPIKQYCIQLLTYKKNRPTKQESLVNSINHKFKNHPEIAENVFKLLKQKKALTITQNKVSYDNAILNLIVSKE